LKAIDAAATASLKGNGKNHLKPSYGDKYKFVGRHNNGRPEDAK